MKVNIYMYQTIRGPGRKAGAYTYILETEIKGKIATLTKTGSFKECTENKAELSVLLEALKRLNKECDVEVFGAGQYIHSGVNDWMEGWIKSGWKNAKGKEVANQVEWQELLKYMEMHHITLNEKAEHSYSNWMKEETDKEKKRCLNDLENLKAQEK